jgi:phosphotransacetylase
LKDLYNDAAVDMEVDKEMPNSEVRTGKCVIFPDLNTGNNTYKAVQEKRSIGYWANVTRAEQTRK